MCVYVQGQGREHKNNGEDGTENIRDSEMNTKIDQRRKERKVEDRDHETIRVTENKLDK